MKRELDKWQFVFEFRPDYINGRSGWRSVALGLMKLTSFPPPGETVTKINYDGVLWRFRLWLPWEKV